MSGAATGAGRIRVGGRWYEVDGAEQLTDGERRELRRLLANRCVPGPCGGPFLEDVDGDLAGHVSDLELEIDDAGDLAATHGDTHEYALIGVVELAERSVSSRRYRSPNGAEWWVADAGDGCVTLELERLPSGEPAQLENRQTFTAWELEEADGWQPIEEGSA